MSFAPPPPQTPGYGAIPAQGGPIFHLSPWPKRVAGSLIDSIVQFLPGLGILARSTAVFLLLYIISLVLLVWNLVRQGRTGQTVGKSVLGIRLVSETTAEPIGIPLSIVRYFCHFFDGFACMVGYLWPLWDPKRQTFADKFLATVVIDVS